MPRLVSHIISLIVVIFTLVSPYGLQKAIAEENNNLDQLYQEALEHLKTGNIPDAETKFLQVINQNPNHLGALLDLSIAYCQTGRQTEAEALFMQLLTHEDIPASIEELIAYLRQNTCLTPTRLGHWQAFVLAGSGYAKNLNQAPAIDRFFLPPLGIELELAKNAKAINDGFRTLEAGTSWQSENRRWNLSGFAQILKYNHSSQFDTQILQISGTHHGQSGSWLHETRGSLSHLFLNGRSYITAVSSTTSLTRAIDQKMYWLGGASIAMGGLDYPTLPDYRSAISELRGRIHWGKSSAFKMTSELGWQFDYALGDRPGGNRQGPVLQIHATWAPNPTHRLDLAYRHSRIKDESAYSSTFFGDIQRVSTQLGWHANWRYRLSEHMHLLLEARHSRNHDKIALFDYKTSSATLSLEWSPE
jgi:tetratricopeptide (TPR) repeat protein